MHLNDLNCFERLVHLELKGIGLEGEKLNLKNLQIALLENLNEDIKFELACPRLSALSLGYRVEPRLTQETCSSVRHLYIRDGKNDETYLLNLYAKLKNLSTISFLHADDLNSFVLTKLEHKECLRWRKSNGKKEVNYLCRCSLTCPI